MTTTTSDKKNMLDWINGRLKISEPEDIAIEANQTKILKRLKKHQQSTSELCNGFKQLNIHVIGSHKGKKKEKTEKTLKKQWVKFSNLMKMINPQIQEN